MANKVSHDQNFKNLILDYPRDALAFFVPEEAPAPDDQVRIIPARQEQLKQRPGDRFRELDVPLLVEWTDGRREAVLFAIEAESDGRRFSPVRLAHYCLDLLELYGTIRVAPVAIFLRGAVPDSGLLVLGTGNLRSMTFTYYLCKLEEIPADQWRRSDNLVARLNLPNMQSPDERRVEDYADAVRGLLELEPDGDKRAKYIDFIDIYAGLTDNEYRHYKDQYREENSIMQGIVSRARAEGMERGIERGKQQGRVDGERALLERQLRRRFGRLPPEIAVRLGQATTDELEAWGENFFEAQTLEDLFNSSH